jgi:2-C-methyl-D-erythritol 4-phosphate cytidylyltransferase
VRDRPVDVDVVALLLAAGLGSRLGGVAKALVEIGGVPLFVRSLRAMAASGAIGGVIVVAPEDHAEEAGAAAPGVWPDPARVAIVGGGRTRQESVMRGLQAVPAAVRVLVCHDAARPFASPDLFRRVIAGLRGAEGSIPVVPSPDTVKRVRDGVVLETVPRLETALAQTPQAFVASALREAHRRAASEGWEATDDAMLLEACGFRVAVVTGEATNFKVTTPDDLRRAQAIAAAASAPEEFPHG